MTIPCTLGAINNGPIDREIDRTALQFIAMDMDGTILDDRYSLFAAGCFRTYRVTGSGQKDYHCNRPYVLWPLSVISSGKSSPMAMSARTAQTSLEQKALESLHITSQQRQYQF